MSSDPREEPLSRLVREGHLLAGRLVVSPKRRADALGLNPHRPALPGADRKRGGPAPVLVRVSEERERDLARLLDPLGAALGEF